MAVVETERHGQIMVVRLNRPDRLNALGQELRAGMAQAWCEFRDRDELEVAVFTGTGNLEPVSVKAGIKGKVQMFPGQLRIRERKRSISCGGKSGRKSMSESCG